MIPIYYLSLLEDTPCKDYWDYGIIYDLFGEMSYEEVRSVPKTNAAIVVIPARSHKDVIEEVNQELSKLEGVVLFLMGDEENVFPIEEIKHNNIRIWVQNPRPGRHDKFRKLGTGAPPQIQDYNVYFKYKTINWFFSGQVTHARRIEMCNYLSKLNDGHLSETKSFTSGMSHNKYYELMSSAKVAPCPSGPVTPDTFRLFEALQLGCVPIADTLTTGQDWTGFWDWLFEEPVPFPQIRNWPDLPGYVEDCCNSYPYLNNRVYAWYFRYKNKLRENLRSDIRAVGGYIHEPISIVIPISPITSHPQTDVLDETISSIRWHFARCPIYLMFDGVRPEQEDKRADYEEFIRRVLFKYRNHHIVPYISDTHVHQIGLMRAAIEMIKTPLLMFVEQDTPIVTDEPIEFDKITAFILSGKSNLVRLYHEGLIHPEHEHLMPTVSFPFTETVQWSQRPHIASTAFYERILQTHFSDKANCFIEDVLHGKELVDYQKHGRHGWDQWKTHIYTPNDKNIKRSYHIDGRAGSEKFDEKQTW